MRMQTTLSQLLQNIPLLCAHLVRIWRIYMLSSLFTNTSHRHSPPPLESHGMTEPLLNKCVFYSFLFSLSHPLHSFFCISSPLFFFLLVAYAPPLLPSTPIFKSLLRFFWSLIRFSVTLNGMVKLSGYCSCTYELDRY